MFGSLYVLYLTPLKQKDFQKHDFALIAWLPVTYGQLKYKITLLDSGYFWFYLMSVPPKKSYWRAEASNPLRDLAHSQKNLQMTISLSTTRGSNISNVKWNVYFTSVSMLFVLVSTYACVGPHVFLFFFFQFAYI